LNESNLLDRGRYYGTALSHRVTGELTLAEGRYPRRSWIPPHAHSAHYFCLVLEGWFEESWGSRRETCGAGTLVFHRASEVHADRFGDTGGRCFNLELAPTLAERLAEEGALPRTRLTLPPGRAGALAAALRGARDPLEIEGTLLTLLTELTPSTTPAIEPGRRPAWLDRSLERLRTASPPSIASLADEAGVHPVYFTRAFRAAFRSTPGAIARRARLERAATALLSSEAPVAAVAYAAGFADHSHFCRHFGRAFGLTPSRYRKLFERPPETG
jgi:AraC family transcriptional regulator